MTERKKRKKRVLYLYVREGLAIFQQSDDLKYYEKRLDKRYKKSYMKDLVELKVTLERLKRLP